MKRGPEELVAMIEKRQAEVETMLAGSLTFAFFKAALLQACRKTPKLLECHPASVYQAALDCAMTGLIRAARPCCFRRPAAPAGPQTGRARCSTP